MSDNTTHSAPAAAAQQAALERVNSASRTDRALSQVGWWTPEIAGATAVGGLGAVTLHPVAAAVAATLLGARIGWAYLRNRRDQHGKAIPDNSTPDADTAEDAASTGTEDAEGVEGVA